MLTANIRQAIVIIKELYNAKESVVLMGSPGIGKSAAFKQAAKELKIGYKATEASSLDATDTRGIPYVIDGESKYGRPTILPTKEDGKTGILVIEELASCLPSTQVALYPLFHPDERRAGDYKLADGWVPMGTGNYVTDGACAYNVSTALKDRVVMVNVEADMETWRKDFAVPANIDSSIMAFLRAMPDMFSTFDAKNNKARDKGFASARTWEKADKILKSSLQGHERLVSLAGCLGEGIAIKLDGFIKKKELLPNIEDIYHGKKIKIPTDGDLLYALSEMLVGFLRNITIDLPKSIAVERMLKFTHKLPGEYAVAAVKDAMVLHDKDLRKSAEWVKWTKKFSDIVI